MDPELECPRCGRAYPASERFCETCRMPLVHSERDEPPTSERQRMARKIDPLYTQGRLVGVACAQNLAEAEFIAGLLLEEGIPSLLQPLGVVEVYALMVGPREVLVHESAAQAAREALTWDRS